MIDLETLVPISWTPNNKKRYESKGYDYTKQHDTFYVKIKDLSPGSHVKVPVICDFCGAESLMTYQKYNSRNNERFDCCNKCKGYKSANTTWQKRADSSWIKLENFCKEKGYELITTKDDFTGTKMSIEYFCPAHGVQHSILNNMLRGHGCKGCKYEHLSDTKRRTSDEVEKIINSTNGNVLLNKEEYKSIFESNLRVLCGCGREYIVSLRNYNLGQTRCSFCSHSKSSHEWYIYNLLTDAKISFIDEYTISDLRDIGALRFDFYLPDYNLVIEYDGEGHYLECFYRNFSDDPHQSLLNAQRRDKLKDEYCDKNGINILRIPYWDARNIDEIIFDKLNELEELKEVV